MSLDAQLAAFKHRQQNQPVLPRPIIKFQKDEEQKYPYAPSPNELSNVTNTNLLQPPKKRQKTSIVYSQPQDTGRGQHLYTQLTYAVDYLKQHTEPIPAEKI